MHDDLRLSDSPDAYLAAREFRLLIAKLEWLGLGEEAEQLEETLCTIAPERFVFVIPEGTD